MKSKTLFICRFICLSILLSLLVLPTYTLAKTYPVTWSPKGIEQTIGLGGAKDLTATFISTDSLDNVDLWIVPELQPFVSLVPDHFEHIEAGTPYEVAVNLLIPYGSETRPYDGTVHLRVGSETYPQMLKVELMVFDAAESIGPAGGIIEVTDPASPIFRSKAVIPEGALSESRTVILNWIEDPPAMPDWCSATGNFIHFSGEGFTTFDRPVSFFVPYLDEDNDGIVDGTLIHELSGLGAMFFDEYTYKWENFIVVEIDGIANLLEMVAAALSVVTPVVFDNTGPSLRLMTYNAAFTVTGMPDTNIIHPVTKQVLEYDDEDDVEERARLIVEGIHRVDPDILVLNEIWDDSAEEYLRDHLKGDYPNYVQYLDGDTIWVQDSGLMLFSKYQFPFIPLSFSPSPTFRPGDGDCIARHATQGDWCDHLGFADFAGSCESYDCLANKGAGLVRMQNMSTHEEFTVVFTHLQASYGEDDWEDREHQVFVRRSQMFFIEDMINNCLTPHEAQGDPIFMLGDLNINGHTLSDDPSMPNYGEWDYFFNDAYYGDITHGFYACGLNNPCPTSQLSSMFVDTWGYETSPNDFGRTTGCNFLFSPDQPTCGDRLDYILHSKPHGGVCAQHIAKAWNVHYQGSIHPYSDHVPVVGDFNKCSDYCQANIARPVPYLNPGEDDVYSNGEIKYPGSMQWHIIGDPGCYAISISGADAQHVGLDIYESHDLSRPIKPYGGQPHPEFGPKFRMPDPPYYLRVFAQVWKGDRFVPDRKWYGHYKIMIHRLDCTDKYESCPLDPVVRDDNNKFPWPTNSVNPYDTIWYSFMTDQGERGDFPTLTFYLVLPDGTVVPEYDQANYELEIETTDSFFIPFAEKGTADEGKQIFGMANELEGDGGQEKEYYLKVIRDPSMGPEMTEVFYHTTLTYFYPQMVVCEEQDDTFGDDDVYYYMEVDSADGWYDDRYKDVHNDPQWSYLAEFDTGSSYGGVWFDWGDPLRPGYPRKYMNWVVINLVEYDFVGINDPLFPYGGRVHEPRPNWRIYPLAEDQEKFIGPLIWWAPLGYYSSPHYLLHGTLTHKPPEKESPMSY